MMSIGRVRERISLNGKHDAPESSASRPDEQLSRPEAEPPPGGESKIVVGAGVSMFVAAQFVGPLPPAEETVRYPQSYQDVILEEYRAGAAHARAMDNRDRNYRDQYVNHARNGLFLGAAVVVVFAVTSLIMVVTNHDAAGGVVGVGDVGLLAGTFVYGARGQGPDGRNRTVASGDGERGAS